MNDPVRQPKHGEKVRLGAITTFSATLSLVGQPNPVATSRLRVSLSPHAGKLIDPNHPAAPIRLAMVPVRELTAKDQEVRIGLMEPESVANGSARPRRLLSRNVSDPARVKTANSRLRS